MQSSQHLLLHSYFPYTQSYHLTLLYQTLPGWHTTIFPPYFVAGAVFSGFAMVITLMTVVRHIYKLENLITIRHLENMCKIILLTGTLVGYAYAMEFFIAWYSGVEFESYAFINRAFGQYGWAYFIMIACNVISPQFFWFKWCRTNVVFMFIISIFVNIGMWFERFVITMTLNNDFLPSSWDYYAPTIWDVSTFIGSFGLFFPSLTLLTLPSNRCNLLRLRIACRKLIHITEITTNVYSRKRMGSHF